MVIYVPTSASTSVDKKGFGVISFPLGMAYMVVTSKIELPRAFEEVCVACVVGMGSLSSLDHLFAITCPDTLIQFGSIGYFIR